MEWLHVETIEPDTPLRVASDDLPEEGHAIKAYYKLPDDDRTLEIVVCRVGGELFALDSLCPHEGGRLADGPLMDGETVHCPLHLYKFRPQDGEAIDVQCDPAMTFDVTLDEAGLAVDVHHPRHP